MKNKIVLITGATGGIGKQTAISLAKMGATVVISGRSKVSAEAAVTEIKSVNWMF
jgi:NAD(P)-dependent dehydrogenase (short-subunit alcohol dehydrogenase family)